MNYDCIIIGGGIAGLQAAIQLGRYQHTVLVIDNDNGRSNLCKSYHNILGWPDGVAGEFLRETGRSQAESLHVEFETGTVDKISRQNEIFKVISKNASWNGKRILIATGVMDRIPIMDAIQSCLGISVYICPDCDGYEVKGKKTIVIGSGNVGAHMALTLSYWTDQLTYVNHEKKDLDESLQIKLQQEGIKYYSNRISQVLKEGAYISGVELDNDTTILAEKGFVAFGGNEVRSNLAEALGVELFHNKHILINNRTKETNVEHVWAAGDVVAHSEQATIAMGDGMQAAIWMHKSLL